jgi:hypothetical protein
MTAEHSRRRAIVTSWHYAGCALEEAVSMYEFRDRAIAGWSNFTIAIKEAIVAEATLRIAQAGLDKKLIAEVEKVVRSKTRPRKEKNGKKPVVEPILAPSPVTAARLPEEMLTQEPEQALTAVSEPHANEQDAAATDASAVAPQEGGGFPGLWRNHDGARWEPREEPFRGFESPPGRF